MRSDGNPCASLVGMQSGTAAVEAMWWFFKKLNIDLPYNPAILLLDMCPKVIESRVSHRYSYTNGHSSSICNGPKVTTIQVLTDNPRTNGQARCSVHIQWNIIEP